MKNKLLTEDQVHSILSSLPDLTFVLDGEGKITGYFTRNEKDLFVPPDVFLNKHFGDFLPPDITRKTHQAFEQAQRSGEITTVHYTLPLGNEMENYEGRFAPYPGGKGASFVVRNVTSQMQTEQKLQSLSTLHQLIVEFSSLLIQSTLDKIDHAIDKTLHMLGEYAAVDRVYIFEHDAAQDEVNNTYEWCAAGINPEIDNLKGVPFDAVPRWKEKFNLKEHVYIPLVAEIDPQYSVEKEILEPQGIQSLLSIPMFYGEKFIGFIGFDSVRHTREWSDEHISLLRLAGEIIAGTIFRLKFEKEIIEARKEAEQASKAKSEFLANMSHEIRTPMNAILGFSEILYNNSDNPKNKNYLSGILSSGKTLLYLINDILDLSKIEAGQMEIMPEPARILDIFIELEKIFTTKLEEKQLELRIHVAESLPEIVLIDDVRLRQVLFNLVGNAIKFTTRGHIEIKAEAMPAAGDDERIDISISVTDTGIGIPESYQKKIFDAFVQVETDNKKQYGGTGLGLAITNRLVHMMNGEIKVQSKVNQGSTFTVVFHNVEPTNALPDRKSVFEWSDKVIKFRPSTVLVVDDVDFNRELVKSYLSAFDFTVFEAKGAREGVTLAQMHKPDLILMDLRMPGMNGYEATREIKSDPEISGIPCVAFTASSMKHDEAAIRELFDDYLLKPLTRNELIDCLLKFLPHELSDPGTSDEIAGKSQEEKLFEQLAGDRTKTIALSESLKTKVRPHLEKLLIYIDPDIMQNLLEELIKIDEKFGLVIFNELSESLKEADESYDFEMISKRLKHLENLIGKIQSINNE